MRHSFTIVALVIAALTAFHLWQQAAHFKELFLWQDRLSQSLVSGANQRFETRSFYSGLLASDNLYSEDIEYFKSTEVFLPSPDIKSLSLESPAKTHLLELYAQKRDVVDTFSHLANEQQHGALLQWTESLTLLLRDIQNAESDLVHEVAEHQQEHFTRTLVTSILMSLLALVLLLTPVLFRIFRKTRLVTALSEEIANQEARHQQSHLNIEQVSHDLEQEKVRVENLAMENQQLAEIVEQASDAIFRLNAEGMVESFNHAATILIPGLQGHPLFAYLFREEDSAEITRAIHLCYHQSQVVKIQVQVPAEHQAIALELTFSPIFTSGPDHQRPEQTVSVIARDITSEALEQTQLRLIIDQAPNALMVVDNNGKIQMTNNQTARMFGYKPEELVNQPVELLVPDRFKESHPTFKAEFLKKPAKRYMGVGRDLAAKKKSGEEFSVEVGLNPISVNDERFVVVSVVDITQRIQQTEQLRAILDQVPNALLVVDHEGRILMCNAEAETLFKYSFEELDHQLIEILIPKEIRQEHPMLRKGFYELPQGRKMGEGRDLTALDKEGRHIPVEVGLNPVNIGDTTHVVVSVLDLSERKVHESELKALNATLRKTNNEMEQFIFTVSHDLKTPLFTINGFAKQLHDSLAGQLDEKQEHQFQRIETNVQQMEGLLEDLLELSRVIKEEPDKYEINLQFVLDQVKNSLEQTMMENDVELIVEHPLELITANDRMMYQVLLNLISNAIKYRSPNRTPVITISTRRQHNMVLLSVKDNGEGIERRHQERIFKIFERLHTGEGSGIGLTIVKTIMDKHHGLITLDSKPNYGSTFTLHFPSGGLEKTRQK